MAVPQLVPDIRMVHEQMPGGVVLEDLNDGWNKMLRRAADKKVNVVRHTFHFVDDEAQIVCNSLNLFLEECFDIASKNLPAVLDTPYNVILDSVNISTTICKLRRTSI